MAKKKSKKKDDELDVFRTMLVNQLSGIVGEFNSCTELLKNTLESVETKNDVLSFIGVHDTIARDIRIATIKYEAFIAATKEVLKYKENK